MAIVDLFDQVAKVKGLQLLSLLVESAWVVPSVVCVNSFTWKHKSFVVVLRLLVHIYYKNVRKIILQDVLDFYLILTLIVFIGLNYWEVLAKYSIILQLILNMLFQTKTGGNKDRSKTPVKSQSYLNSTPKVLKKDVSKVQSNFKQKNVSKESSTIKYKTKDSFLILQSLEDIYNELNFNDYDIFPLENIDRAKKNIENLLTFLGAEPICRYHKDLLNLYCQNDKSVICVSCIYKVGEHKNHKIKSLQNVQKIIDLQTIRNQEKTRSLIHQLSQLKDEIDFMTKQIGQNYMMISKYTISIIDESIKELNAMKTDMEKKLSLAYRRTTTVINRYNQALNLVVNHLENNVQKTVVMNSLSKHMLLKELTTEGDLIESLVSKFSENRLLMEQWNKSNREFEKAVLRKRNSITQRVDSFVVTQF